MLSEREATVTKKLNGLQLLMLGDINEEIRDLENRIALLNKKAADIYSKEPLRMFYFHEYGPEIIEVDAIYYDMSKVHPNTQVYFIWNPIKKDKDREWYPGGLVFHTREELIDTLLPQFEEEANDESLAITPRFRAGKIVEFLRSELNKA